MSGSERLWHPSLRPPGIYGGATRRGTDSPASREQQTPWKRAGVEESIEPRLMREELQHLSQSLEARASEKTADLIAGEGRIEMPQEQEPQQSWLDKYATAQSEMSDFDRLLTIIQGYTTIMKST